MAHVSWAKVTYQAKYEIAMYAAGLSQHYGAYGGRGLRKMICPHRNAATLTILTTWTRYRNMLNVIFPVCSLRTCCCCYVLCLRPFNPSFPRANACCTSTQEMCMVELRQTSLNFTFLVFESHPNNTHWDQASTQDAPNRLSFLWHSLPSQLCDR